MKFQRITLLRFDHSFANFHRNTFVGMCDQERSNGCILVLVVVCMQDILCRVIYLSKRYLSQVLFHVAD